MLLEASRVLEEGIVREPADVDMGLILGIGFPPFQGGPLRWADRRRGHGRDRPIGWSRSGQLGKRFEPTETLIRSGQNRRSLLSHPGQVRSSRSLPSERSHETEGSRVPCDTPSSSMPSGRPWVGRRRTRGTFETSGPRTFRPTRSGRRDRPDEDRPEVDRGRSLGLRPAAGGAGVQRRPDRRAGGGPAGRGRAA